MKAIIFDLDNTLLDRTTTFRNFVHRFNQQFFSASSENVHQLNTDLIVKLDDDGYKQKPQLFAELIETLPWPQGDLLPNVDMLMDFYANEYVNEATLMSHAEEVLSFCKNRYKLGLITNGMDSIQYGKIQRLNIKHYFDSIVVSEGAGVKKPDRRIFDIALRELELSAEECIYVGDHPKNDMEGAALAGLQTIWLEVNQPWRDDLNVVPLKKLRQLRELIYFLA
ncbi:HAD family hydrolase [Paenibacillus swuensis]|uniref:HAD family hydrolase n=1 Tax=Paenibacillus swuensis TaxID=1178515 RepID=UPI001E5D1FE3|nr:HAD family hydrolase [Paenibacillus swuensis]